MELETKKDGLKFTCRNLAKCAAELWQLTVEYEARQEHLVAQVADVGATFTEVWQRVVPLLAELDVLAGFADLAVSAPRAYTRPTMLPADGEAAPA